MAMLTAGLQEMLVLTDTSHTTLRSQRHRGTAVAAFGTTQPLLDTRWLLIDGAAMLIRDDLLRDVHARCGSDDTSILARMDRSTGSYGAPRRTLAFYRGGTQRRQM